MRYNLHMHHFFVKPSAVSNGTVMFDKEQAHHIGRVLRLNPGDQVTVADNTGTVYHCRLEMQAGGVLSSKILETSTPAPVPTKLVLCVSLLKGAKMELVVQKTTELGVDEIRPFVSSRSVSRPPAPKGERKAEKLSRVALAASEQSRRTILPKVHTTAEWPGFIEFIEAASGPVLVAWEEEEARLIQSVISADSVDTVAVIIGPEGGFSQSEVHEFVSRGATTISLGPNVLRAETAAIAATAVLRGCFQATAPREGPG